MNQPLISVIVPCYNQAQYLDECLQSVLNQTFQNWECIIVNDGSPDNTEDIALLWTKKDSRFKYLKKENGGLSSARNAGIEIAIGDWILPLDADDKIGDRYLELASEEFENGYNIIYCKAYLFGQTNELLNSPIYNRQEILYRNSIFASALYQKKMWSEIGGYDILMRSGYEDWEFWINLIYNANAQVHRIDYIGFYYRRKEQSMDTIINSNLDTVIATKKYIIKKHSLHYANHMSKVIDLYYLASTRNNFLKEIHNLFYTSIIGKLLWKLAKINSQIFNKN